MSYACPSQLVHQQHISTQLRMARTRRLVLPSAAVQTLYLPYSWLCAMMQCLLCCRVQLHSVCPFVFTLQPLLLLQVSDTLTTLDVLLSDLQGVGRMPDGWLKVCCLISCI